MATVVTIDGLTTAQCTALAGIKVGDLFFVQKVTPLPANDDDDDDDDDDNDEHEVDGDGEDGDYEGDAEDQVVGESESASQGSDANDNAYSDEEGTEEEEGDAEDTEDIEATDIFVPPRMYVCSATLRDHATGCIVSIQATHLTYSSTIDQDGGSHSYQIFGKRCVHNHLNACSQGVDPCNSESMITEILRDASFLPTLSPDGDFVKRLDQDFRNASGYGRCIPGCNNGYLAQHGMLRHMVKDYEPPTLSVEDQDLSKVMPSVCPVCFGVGVLKEQQNLLVMMLLGAPPEIGDIIEFIGSLDRRRRELGYRFRQFDEREWSMVFDDIPSDEEYDESEGDNRWEQWAEAMDPNSVIQCRPASDATIASLIRKAAKDTTLGEESRCKICLGEIQKEHVLIELPCGHVDQHEECIAQWLKYNTACPSCRKIVPGASDGESSGILSDGEQIPHENHAEAIDGENTVMSDA